MSVSPTGSACYCNRKQPAIVVALQNEASQERQWLSSTTLVVEAEQSVTGVSVSGHELTWQRRYTHRLFCIVHLSWHYLGQIQRSKSLSLGEKCRHCGSCDLERRVCLVCDRRCKGLVAVARSVLYSDVCVYTRRAKVIIIYRRNSSTDLRRYLGETSN